ncbi:MAG: riboflavin biosynthesis protein RibF [Puniceicoccales bacterium]|jgi:riboflavin kinase/FMN adenylyltransferase|nr:riboflavin biosynthesis protein RibF [Puniceicoccales bacterium]
MLRFDSLALFPALPPPVHLAIGVFDGVHLGHRAVIGAAAAAAAASGGSAAILTFSPHPSHILHPKRLVPCIYDDAQKDRLFAELGAQCVVHEPFTPEFAAMDAQAFLNLLLRHVRSLTSIHVGTDFRFGRGRGGNVALLATLAKTLGLHVTATADVVADGSRVSSTRIRALLETGDVAGAAALLGRAYTTEGVVVGGRALGRTIGAPTLNLPWEPEARPRAGVYAVRAQRGERGKWFPGIANYGLRPTIFSSTATPASALLETHLLADTAAVAAAGFNEGARLRVEWLHFFRPEKKFTDISALRSQIERDITAARAWFASRNEDFAPAAAPARLCACQHGHTP